MQKPGRPSEALTKRCHLIARFRTEAYPTPFNAHQWKSLGSLVAITSMPPDLQKATVCSAAHGPCTTFSVNKRINNNDFTRFVQCNARQWNLGTTFEVSYIFATSVRSSHQIEVSVVRMNFTLSWQTYEASNFFQDSIATTKHAQLVESCLFMGCEVQKDVRGVASRTAVRTLSFIATAELIGADRWWSSRQKLLRPRLLFSSAYDACKHCLNKLPQKWKGICLRNGRAETGH